MIAEVTVEEARVIASGINFSTNTVEVWRKVKKLKNNCRILRVSGCFGECVGDC